MPDNESGGILDLILTQAARQVADELGAELAGPAPEEECTRRAAAAPTARHRPGRLRAFRWAACLVAVMFMGSAGVAVSVKAVRGSVINFMFDPDAPGSEITFNLSARPRTSYIGTFAALNYVPSGFECMENKAFSATETLYFQKHELWFCFTILSDGHITIDTENAKYEQIEINGYDAVYLEKENYSSLTWSDGEFPYHINGNIDKKTMIKIAENVKPI